MANDLVRKNNPLVKALEKSLSTGSLSDLVRAQQDQNILLLLDVSGSMGSGMSNGRQRIDALETS